MLSSGCDKTDEECRSRTTQDGRRMGVVKLALLNRKPRFKSKSSWRNLLPTLLGELPGVVRLPTYAPPRHYNFRVVGFLE
jgi:hypothetical protein